MCIRDRKKADQELQVAMHQWAEAKAKITEEISRKAIAQKEQSQFDECYFKRKKIDIRKVEDLLGKKEVERVMKMYSMKNYYVRGKDNINGEVQEDEEEDDEDESSSYEDVEEEEEEQEANLKQNESQQQQQEKEEKPNNENAEQSSYEEGSSYEEDETSQRLKKELQEKKQQTRPYSGKLSVKDFSKVLPQQQQSQLPPLIRQYSIQNLEGKIIKRDIYHTRLLNQNYIRQKLNVFAKPEEQQQLSWQPNLSQNNNSKENESKQDMKRISSAKQQQQQQQQQVDKKNQGKQQQQQQQQQQQNKEEQKPVSPKNLKPRPQRKCLPQGNANQVLLNDYEKDNPDKPTRQLSIFGKRPENNELPSMKPEKKQRPYSAIVQRMNMEELHNEQMKEILQIKERLAREKINVGIDMLAKGIMTVEGFNNEEDLNRIPVPGASLLCLLYTSDAADEEDSVDLGGRRIIKTKKNRYAGATKHTSNTGN
eukprot:TRINITY_DN2305_c0_g1_i4.p1 TRINITY_DN2305_c0_g1~~TRINITY_DN2305_c0_g1_i4.p1  ORF type:complete len:481 (+),score=135.16 TRINITY_DN2305_c0_g1_i4:150-1592(+)